MQLSIINHPKTRTVAFKGMSFCRCCGNTNGSEEHLISIHKTTYCIPDGYMHYLDVHKVAVDEKIEAIFNYLYLYN